MIDSTAEPPDDAAPETEDYWQLVRQGAGAAREMKIFAANIERDRNKLRLELHSMLAREHLTCGWCGEMMQAPHGFKPPITAKNLRQTVRLHLLDCPKHPIRETERVLEEEREWLADTREALAKVKAERDAARKDSARLDWLADRRNTVGNVELPRQCVLEHLDDMRAAIDAAMRQAPISS